MKASLLLMALCLSPLLAVRHERGLFDEAEKLLSSLNHGLDHLQAEARDHFGRLRPLAERVESEVGPAVHRVGQTVNSAFNTMLQRMGGMANDPFGVERVDTRVAQREEPSSGPGIGHFLQPFDPYSIFGLGRRRRWWEGPNVCVERKVIDESGQEEIAEVVGGEAPEDQESTRRKRRRPSETSSNPLFMMDMTMTSCRDGDQFHECTTHVNTNGRRKTVVTLHQCCYGFSRDHDSDSTGCDRVEVKSVLETVRDLQGDEFLQLVQSAGMEEDIKAENVTLLVPTNDAVEDFRHDLEQANSLGTEVTLVDGEGGEKSVHYSVDDGLLSRRRKRELAGVGTEPELDDLIKNHILSGLLDSSRLHDEDMVETAADGSKIRMTVYNTYPEKVVMANCAKLTSLDHHTDSGLVHSVDKVVLPSRRSLADILAEDSQFTTLVDLLERAGLLEQLQTIDGQLTVFAPTNAAFEQLDERTMEKLLSGNGCARDILGNHFLPNVICTGVIEAKARTVNSQDKYMILDRDEEDNLMVEDVKIVVRDVVGTNGVLHAIDQVIIPESARDVDDALEATGADTLRELFAEAGITGEGVSSSLSNSTIFAPSEKALESLPAEFMKELRSDKGKLRDFLMYHVAEPKTCKCDFEDGKLLSSGLDDKKLRLNVYSSAPVNLFDLQPKQFATVQCAKITKLDSEVCGSIIHSVDKVLLPPAGSVLQVMRNSKQFDKFLRLVKAAEMEEELNDVDGPYTVLAPVDSAFDLLDDDLKFSTIEESREKSLRMVRRHLLTGQVCCSGVPRQVPLFDASGHRTQEGDVASLRRSAAGHIYADRAEVVRCDMVGDNGVVHAIDRAMVPDALRPEQELRRERQRAAQSRKGFNIFKIF